MEFDKPTKRLDGGQKWWKSFFCMVLFISTFEDLKYLNSDFDVKGRKLFSRILLAFFFIISCWVSMS